MPQQVLSDADRKKINAALHTLAELLPEVQRAKAAGEDVSDVEARMAHQQKRLAAYKAVYFPDKP